MKVIESNNGRYEVYESYLVVKYFEGVHLNPETEGDAIIEILASHFKQTFGWISDRENSYSFDPLLLDYVIKNFDGFRFFGTVVYGSAAKTTDYLSDVFPDQIKLAEFNSLLLARQWLELELSQVG